MSGAVRLLIGDLVISRRVLVEMDDHGVPRFRLGLGLFLPLFPLDFVSDDSCLNFSAFCYLERFDSSFD